jgi:hypothetical protein
MKKDRKGRLIYNEFFIRGWDVNLEPSCITHEDQFNIRCRSCGCRSFWPHGYVAGWVHHKYVCMGCGRPHYMMITGGCGPSKEIDKKAEEKFKGWVEGWKERTGRLY